MGCNYTAPGPELAGRERELAGARKLEGERGRRGTHVTLIDSPGERRAGASGERSLSKKPCSCLPFRLCLGKLRHGDEQDPYPDLYIGPSLPHLTWRQKLSNARNL